jgi:indole-3-acetate monooxygenase
VRKSTISADISLFGCRDRIYGADVVGQAMDLMFRHGGSTSFKTASRLAEVWRDLQVVGQAATLAPEWYPGP